MISSRLRADAPTSLLRGVLFGIIGAVAYAVPARFMIIDPPMPWLALAAVFFWATTRPGAAAVAATFGLGLFQDIVTGGPVGVWALAYLTGYAVAAAQRDALTGQSRAAVWIGFGVCAIAAAFGGWVAAWVAAGHAPGVGALIAQAAMTTLLAPIAGRFLGGFSRIAAREAAL